MDALSFAAGLGVGVMVGMAVAGFLLKVLPQMAEDAAKARRVVEAKAKPKEPWNKHVKPEWPREDERGFTDIKVCRGCGVMSNAYDNMSAGTPCKWCGSEKERQGVGMWSDALGKWVPPHGKQLPEADNASA